MPGSYFANPTDSWPSLLNRIQQLKTLPIPGASGAFINALRYIGWLGDQGVQIFLVASGFGLTYAALKKNETIRADAFYKRRLMTILPLWWVSHIVFLILSLFSNKGMQVTDWRTLASFVGLRFIPRVFYFFSPAWWFIGLLLQLYLVFPFLYRLLMKMKPVRFFLIIGGCAVVIRLAGLLILHRQLDWWSRGGIFISRLPEFVFGMSFAALLFNNSEKTNRWTKTPFAILSWILVYVLGNLFSFTLLGMAVAFLFTGAGAFVMLFSMMSTIKKPITGVFSWAGRHSYSIFLIHHPILIFLVSSSLPLIALSKILALLALSSVITLPAALALEAITNGTIQFISKQRRKKNIWNVTFPIMLAILGAFALALAAELLVRILDPQEVLGWGERPALEKHDNFYYRMKPNRTIRLRWLSYDYTVYTNSLGFPGPEYSPQKAANVYRIYITGDAFESAEGVDTDQAWPRLLEKYLNAANSREYQVMNFAVTGWGPRQYNAAIQEFAPVYNPDMIIIGFFVNEYFDVGLGQHEYESSIGFDNLPQNSFMAYIRLSHLRGFISDKKKRFNEILNGEEYQPGYLLGNFGSFERSNFDRMQESSVQVERHLLSIKLTAKKIGAKLLVVMIPASIQVNDSGALKYYPRNINISDTNRFDMNQPQRLTMSICAKLDIDFIDLRPPLQAVSGQAPYQKRNMHWTELGHRIVAEYLSKKLIEQDAMK